MFLMASTLLAGATTHTTLAFLISSPVSFDVFPSAIVVRMHSKDNHVLTVDDLGNNFVSGCLRRYGGGGNSLYQLDVIRLRGQCNAM